MPCFDRQDACNQRAQLDLLKLRGRQHVGGDVLLLEGGGALQERREVLEREAGVWPHRIGCAALPWVRESYLEHDLTALGDEPLTLMIANAIAGTAAQPFTYAYTYPSQSARRAGELERGDWKSGLPEWLRQTKDAQPPG